VVSLVLGKDYRPLMYSRLVEVVFLGFLRLCMGLLDLFMFVFCFLSFLVRCSFVVWFGGCLHGSSLRTVVLQLI
jgi:hypothetical protein